MSRAGRFESGVFAVVSWLVWSAGVACTGGGTEPDPVGVVTGGRTPEPSTGGRSGTGGGGAGGASTGGSTPVGTGGVAGAGGTGDVAPTPETAVVPEVAVEAGGDAPVGIDTAPPGMIDYGGVDMRPSVPLLYTPTPVPPIIAPECTEDPTQGFTEYPGTFVVQRPIDRAAAERMKYENGIYTFLVQSGDRAHQAGNGTAPRTEARYANFSSGTHIWSGDIMYESASRTCIMQIHNVEPPIAFYLRVLGNRTFNLATGKTILTDYQGKWFNLKVVFNTETLEVKTYVNNCLKETSRAPRGSPNWYFKNGVYTCDSGTCRANFKNVHLYRRD